ncbi:type II and III secretion system protein family protein [Massilia sp. CFBP9012]|uniref:type II and III secretion system protein family protein n=1 Tax=Massilia sp. CFBP9012 TaxID=3096531 RepID=UPI002A6B4B0B|nr:type II and III secretion system protein family protein [Massilia sp. CFBP9012]MDY0973404.1 type II and III secretion system protein family protein [Massilia sp. CFBP9012]
MNPSFNKTLLASHLTLALAMQAGLASAADCIDLRSDAAPRLELVRGKSVIKRFCTPASQVTVGDPQVANVVVPNSGEVVIVARSVGTTNLIVSGRDKKSTVIDIAVGVDTSALRGQFDTLFPQEKDVRIGSSGNALILSGMVSDAVVASQLVELATAFQSIGSSGGEANSGAGSPSLAGVGAPAAASAGGAAPSTGAKVLNMLSIAAPQQVMLEVKIAEVSKSLVDQLGAKAGYTKTNGSWTYGVVSSLLSGGAGSIGGVGTGIKELTIDGEKRDGLVKILAEPNVMAVSGQEASFLAGGKIFIPVAQSSGGGTPTITLEEKEYGVAVKFTPTVLAGGRINLRVAPEVSELNREGIGISTGGSSNASAILPSFTTRRASTTVQLLDGQSFAIGGLIRNNVTSNIKRFPFLGEVPVLGTLFRSSDFQNDRTELVFIVTPRLAKPMEAVPALPTDHYVQPSRTEFLLGGQHEGKRTGATSKE